MSEQDSEISKLYKSVGVLFSGDEGKQVLKQLEGVFMYRPVSPPGQADGYSYFREGQNDLVRMFRIQATKAQKGEQYVRREDAS